MASTVELSRRERQIMDILYKLGRATAAEVLSQMPDELSYSTVRAQLRVLEEKGHARHEEKDLKYVYMPTVPRDKARRSALRHVMETFFNGSPEEMLAALVDHRAARLSHEELDRIADLISRAKKEGR